MRMQLVYRCRTERKIEFALVEQKPVALSICCQVRKGTGSQVLGSWNQEVRADSSFYRVWEATLIAVANCPQRVPSALTLSILSVCTEGTQVYLGACLYSSLQVN